ncbi:hypothetical protein SK128_028178 [Halocaridina rubra]|uniref:Ig-like domain-containing protein n=1 Tax=Halocaridina rubra TaxID=373956 RepID=A0AAN9AEF2_HALRR
MSLFADPPIVSLALGRALDPGRIKEGDDVYFECNIRANPRYHRIIWYHNGREVYQNVSAGVVMSGESLVLPGLHRRHSGSYICLAVNLLGNATSNAVFLTIRHKPVCAGPMVRTQGAVRGSTTIVTCTIEAEPPYDLRWNWMKVKPDGTEEQVSKSLVQSRGMSSNIKVTPLRQDDYGRLLCRATNSIGQQQQPCIISLIPAGPPEMPSNCSAELQDTDELKEAEDESWTDDSEEKTENEGEGPDSSWIIVKCFEGFNGGLRQLFLLEAWQNGRLLTNLSSDIPEWVLIGVRMGTGITLTITSQNDRGQSKPVTLEVHDSKAQQHAAPDFRSIAALASLLGAVVGATGVFLVLLIVGIILAKRSLRSSRHTRKPEGVLPRTSSVPEGFDPDVVTSVQRQPPSLDVLPCLQVKEGKEETSSLCSAETREIHESSFKGQSYEQLLYDNAEGQFHFNGVAKEKKSEKSRRTKEGSEIVLQNNDDSGLSDSDTDSEIKKLVTKRQLSRVLPKAFSQAHLQKSSGIEHLNEPSTSSGDSGIHSSSSMKPFSMFSASDEKGEPTSLATDLRSTQIRTLSKQSFRVLEGSSSGELKRGLLSSYSSPTSSNTSIVPLDKTAALEASKSHSKMNKREIFEDVPDKCVSFMLPSEGVVKDDISLHNLSYFGRPVTLLERDNEEVVLKRRTMPKTETERLRRNSAFMFVNDKIYDLPAVLYSSSCDLQFSGYPAAHIKDIKQKNARIDLSHNKTFDANLNTIKQMNVQPLSTADQKDINIIKKSSKENCYKFQFNRNYSDRESSV